MRLLQVFLSACFSLSPLTYVPQLLKLVNPPLTPTKTAFTPTIPMILTSCHTLRIIAYLMGGEVKPGIALQSAGMVVVTVAMLHYWLKGRSEVNPSNLMDSLKYTSRTLRYTLIVIFTATMLFDILLLRSGQLNISKVILILSLALEALPPLVQLNAIVKSNTTAGISKIMVLSWLAGDTTRATLFAMDSDNLFSAGAMLCVVADVIVVVRVWSFKELGGDKIKSIGKTVTQNLLRQRSPST